MKSLSEILFLLLFVSCWQITSTVKQEGYLINAPITNHSKKVEVIASNPVKEQKYRWVQYKRVPVMDANDTIPIKNCYLLIKSNIVSIYVSDTIAERHNLIRDNQYSFPSYYFEDNPDDVLQYLDKEQSKLVIKRDNFDGLQEYYIKKVVIGGNLPHSNN